MIDVKSHFHNCVLLSNIALTDNQSVHEKLLGQGSMFAVPIFSFHVVNHKYFSICEELHSGAIRKNSTALIKMWHFLEGVSLPPTKKNWGRSCCLLPLCKENCKHTFLPSCQESDRPRSVFVPKQNVSQSSIEVSVYISYIRGQNVLWDLLKNFQSRQNYKCPERCVCGGLLFAFFRISQDSWDLGKSQK